MSLVSFAGEAVVRADEHWLGFADEEITNAMLYKNAFHTGDAWCRSGDLMDVDRMGFFYFVARLSEGSLLGAIQSDIWC